MNIQEKVEQSLREAQENKAFKDSEIRIGGSKKEMAALRKLLQEARLDPDNIAKVEADFGDIAMSKIVNKNEVFPVFDPAAQREMGVSSGAAYLKTRLRNAFPASPVKNNPIARLVYVGFANLLYDTFLKKPTVESFQESQKYIADNVKWFFTKFIIGNRYAETVQLLHNMYKFTGNLRTEFVDYEDAVTYIAEKVARNSTERGEWPMIADRGYDRSNVPHPFVMVAIAFWELTFDGKNLTRHVQYTTSYTGSDFRFTREILGGRFASWFIAESWKKSKSEIDAEFAKTLSAISEDESIVRTESECWQYKEDIAKYQDQIMQLSLIKDYDSVTELIDGNIIPDSAVSMRDFVDKSGRLIPLGYVGFSSLVRNEDKDKWIASVQKTWEIRLAHNITQLNECIAKNKPRPENWEWAFPKDTEEEKKTTKEKYKKPMLDYIERKGGLKIDRSQIYDIESIKRYMSEHFGFRAYEFGKSLKDIEAAEIVFHFLGAVADFAEILNIDFKGINEKMGLSMGFASRGSGSASAHYENKGRIVNLTKSNGDGSVAHEFAHYLDNIFPDYDHPRSYSMVQWGSVGFGGKTDKHYKPGEISSRNVEYAYRQIMNFILYGIKDTYGAPQTGVIEYVAKAKNSESRKIILNGYKDLIANKPTDPAEIELSLKNFHSWLMARYPNYYKYFENISPANRLVFDIYVRDLGLEQYTFRLPSKMSSYYIESEKVGGNYWVRPIELFARAFEVYVWDKLAAEGRYNNFLVSGAYSDVEEGFIPGYPYPQAKERAHLFRLFNELIEAVKADYQIGDFVPFTSEKNKITKGQIVEYETDEDEEQVSPEAELYLKKLLLLNAMLAENKFGTGGDFKAALSDQDEFNSLFLQVYELINVVDDLHFKNQTHLKPDAETSSAQAKLEGLLGQLYAYPDWKKRLEAIEQIAFKIEKAELFANAKDEILLKLAEDMIVAYDNNDWKSVKVLQIAIEYISQSSAFEDLQNLWRFEEAQQLRLRELVKKRAKGKEKEIVENEVKHLIQEIRYSQTLNIFDIEEIIKRGNDFESHKKFGFDKVNYDGYHAEEIEEIAFGKKPNVVSLEICKDPNGRLYYGTRYQTNNAGSSSGCWLGGKSFSTKEQIYSDFYKAVGDSRFFEKAIAKKIMKEIAEKLAIDSADIDFVEQKAALLEQIKADLSTFVIDGQAQHPELIYLGVEIRVENVGKWISQPEEYAILAPGEEDKYKQHFIDFCRSFPWFDKVNLFFVEHGAYHDFSENYFHLIVKPKEDLDFLPKLDKSKSIDFVSTPVNAKSMRDKIIDTYAEKLTEESVHEEIERGKEQNRTATPEKIAEYKAVMLARNKAQFASLIDAIDNKDYKVLSGRLHLGNKTSRKVFEEYTGIKLGKTLGATLQQLKSLTGYEDPPVVKVPKMSKEDALAKAQKAKDEIVLNKQLRYDGVTRTRKEQVEFVISNGGRVEFVEVDKIKEPSRQQYNRWNYSQQEDFERRRKDAGKKKEYRLFTSDNSFYEITKAEYDYAQEFIEARKNKLELATGGQLADGVIRKDEYGKDIVWENGDYFIAVDDPTNARYITLWKTGEGKIGVLNANLTEMGTYRPGKEGKWLSIQSARIDPKYRGNHFAIQMYRALLRFASPEVKGIFSYLPNRSNKKQVPAIYRRFNAETIGDYQFIAKDENKGRFAKGGQIKYDSLGNPIGSGGWNVEYHVFEFNDYPEVSSSVSKSETTESVYVTYSNQNNGKSIKVRFSNHENNAVKFGDQLSGYTTTKPEVLYHLGLMERTFIPNTYLWIDKQSVAKKSIGNYEVADKTIQEMYAMGKDADVSQYKGKLAKDSNYLILGDKVEELEDKTRNFLGQTVTRGKYVYGKTFSTGGQILTHRSIPSLSIELLEQTNKGWKVNETDPKGIGKVRKGKIAFYTEAEIKELFKAPEKEFANGDKVAFKGDDTPYIVVGEDGNNLIVVIEEKMDLWRSANEIDRAEFYEEWIPKDELEKFATGGEIKGITNVNYEDDGQTILYGTKNNQTRISVKGLSAQEIKDEYEFEKMMYEKSISDLPEMKKGAAAIQNLFHASLREKKDALDEVKRVEKNLEVVKKIVLPFYEERLAKLATEKFANGDKVALRGSNTPYVVVGEDNHNNLLVILERNLDLCKSTEERKLYEEWIPKYLFRKLATGGEIEPIYEIMKNLATQLQTQFAHINFEVEPLENGYNGYEIVFSKEGRLRHQRIVQMRIRTPMDNSRHYLPPEKTIYEVDIYYYPETMIYGSLHHDANPTAEHRKETPFTFEEVAALIDNSRLKKIFA